MPRLPLIGAMLLLLGAYALAPGFVLLRLDRAMRHGDAATVRRLVDWPSVRRGLAEEVAGGVLGTPRPRPIPADTGLPPFGSSFIRHIADHEISTRLTPRGLIRLARAGGPDGAPRPSVSLAGIGFDGPGQVAVRLDVAGQPQPIRLGLRLKHGAWKLTRIWLPPDLLRRAAAGGGSGPVLAGSISGDEGPAR